MVEMEGKKREMKEVCSHTLDLAHSFIVQLTREVARIGTLSSFNQSGKLKEVVVVEVVSHIGYFVSWLSFINQLSHSHFLSQVSISV